MMRNRTIITDVKPNLEEGKYYIKRIPGEDVKVSAKIFCDSEDFIRASILFKKENDKQWSEVPMHLVGEDEWEGEFYVTSEGFYLYKIEAWADRLATWFDRFIKKQAKGQHLANDLALGAAMLKAAAKQADKTSAKKLNDWAKQFEKESEYHLAVNTALSNEFKETISRTQLKNHPSTFDKNLKIRVGAPKELFSTWYEMFPRSSSPTPDKHGTFKDCEKLLPRIAGMGFDTLLLPPIFPIGKTNRKGKNNSLVAEEGDVGSPWSVGNENGGHKSINPALGSMADFEKFVKAATKQGIDVALDLGLRCSADHPYVKEHPDWFKRMPDGSLAIDEIPPLYYTDIIEFDFECDDWQNLWNELLSIVLFWAGKGVSIFYVSTPHYKPFHLWKWLIGEVHQQYPHAIFLSGAITRSLVTERLAMSGFNQSLSRFFWKTNKKEIQDYLLEITQSETKEYLHPNFFTNTPDILPSYLASATESLVMLRYALACTLSSNCGIYGPVFELMKNERHPDSKERYFNSEKYQIAHYDWGAQNRITEFISRVNKIRKENSAFHNTFNITFAQTDNDQLLSFVKISVDKSNIVWCIINLDAHHNQSGYVELPKQLLGIKGHWFNLKVEDLLTGETYHWFSDWNFVELKPAIYPMHILKVSLAD
jgi:starch synthase (maltosyl-transferring)